MSINVLHMVWHFSKFKFYKCMVDSNAYMICRQNRIMKVISNGKPCKTDSFVANRPRPHLWPTARLELRNQCTIKLDSIKAATGSPDDLVTRHKGFLTHSRQLVSNPKENILLLCTDSCQSCAHG